MNELMLSSPWLTMLIIGLLYALLILALFTACAWIGIKLYFIQKRRYDKAVRKEE